MFIPIYLRAIIAYGLTCDGFDPALLTIAFYLKILQASPSASWLLAELATHMNKILRDLLG
jgi:hypothetical protein